MSGTHETVAGTMAGIAGKLVEHPLDTIKTRLQEACSSHRTVSDCFQSILKNEGAASFFRGISAPVVASAGEHAFTFLTFSEAISLVERARCHFRGEDAGSAASGRAHSSSSGRAQVPLSTHAIAGGVSGFISATIITPVEYFKCRMQQCNSRKRMTFRDCTRNGGWRHVFDGHVATVARDVPGTAAWFLCYELALRQFRAWEGVEELNATQVAAAGAIAGVMYWSAFFPADVVKTRMQLDSDFCRQGFCRGLRTIAKVEGVRALYRGWSCTMISAVPGNAAIFLTYETVMTYFQEAQIAKEAIQKPLPAALVVC
jgi:solute carrier family 25 carnitine/acylcarnitine transporter 20/29